MTLIWWVVLFLCSHHVSGQESQSGKDLKWPTQKKEYLPGTYWWWMGSAVDKENLTYNLESLRKAGIGNVHVIPIYGVQGQEDYNINFLSPSWMEMLSHTLSEATRLDMNVAPPQAGLLVGRMLLPGMRQRK